MKSKDRLWILIWPILALTVIGLLLLFERSGISYRVSHVETEFLSMDFFKQSKAAKHKTIDCLLIVDSRQETHAEFYDHMTVVLDNMSVGYDVADLAKGGFPKLQGYATAVVLCPDLSPFQDNIFTLCDWVEAGGRCMFFATLDPTVVFRSIASKRGCGRRRGVYQRRRSEDSGQLHGGGGRLRVRLGGALRERSGCAAGRRLHRTCRVQRRQCRADALGAELWQGAVCGQ